MIIASVDLETTGLDPLANSILEFGCILWDTDGAKIPAADMPWFRRGIIWEELKGHPIALHMNADLIRRLAKADYTIAVGGEPDGYCKLGDLGIQFKMWLTEARGMVPDAEGRIKLHPAGKNFGLLDYQFLKFAPDFGRHIRFTHRAFDPAVLFFDPTTDQQLPALEDCCQRAGLAAGVTHQALGDAQAVIECLRYTWSLRR